MVGGRRLPSECAPGHATILTTPLTLTPFIPIFNLTWADLKDGDNVIHSVSLRWGLSPNNTLHECEGM